MEPVALLAFVGIDRSRRAKSSSDRHWDQSSTCRSIGLSELVNDYNDGWLAVGDERTGWVPIGRNVAAEIADFDL